MKKNLDNKIHILFCSRLVKEKGVDILLEVIKKCLSDPLFSEKCIWHITSDGDFVNEIKDLSSQHETEVKYYGKISQNDLASLMRRVDFLYMPSRFLETFGLTALESLACGTGVIGFKKGGLRDFIADDCSLDESNPIESSMNFLKYYLSGNYQSKSIEIQPYAREKWAQGLKKIFPVESNIFILHDYNERIGGAEAYIDNLCDYLPNISYRIVRSSYQGLTSPIKRRVMFIFSIFAFWRGIVVKRKLSLVKPDIIWMHSILRYYGYWGLRSVAKYSQRNNVPVYLSHHDVGFITPFPQFIYSESQIPINASLQEFLRGLKGKRRFIAIFKWLYIRLLRNAFPKNMKHIIFSSFLKDHIMNHFQGASVHILPHTYDENIFHL
ncbi:MAG: hypothetical protein HHAS10_09390 [Candidatus Altimarinota bacterium]